MNGKKRLLRINFPLIIGLITAEMVIYLGEGDKMANYIGLIIALLTVAGSILANFFQYKKDSNKIGEVKEHTSAIKPNVENIKELSKETNDYVTKAVSPDIKNILKNIDGDMKENLSMLAEDLKYRRRLEDSYRGNNSRDILVSGIDELYIDNANQKHEIEKLINLNRELAQSIERKNTRIKELERKNKSLEERIKELTPKRRESGIERE